MRVRCLLCTMVFFQTKRVVTMPSYRNTTWTVLWFGLMLTMQASAEFKEQSFERIMRQHQVAAAAVIVVDAKQVLFNAHLGIRDRNSKQAFSAQDSYRIGSISKSFAGLLAQRLAAQGLIDLSADIEAYGLGAYLKNSYPESKITLAHLLEHTAGLADLSKPEWDYNAAEPISLKTAFDLKLGQHVTRWRPGLGRSYSNVGAGLFGLALENKLGQSYESLMQQQLFDPLGMSASSLLLTPQIKTSLIKGYDRDGHKPIKYWHNIYRPFAAINTNSADMIKWLQMWLQQPTDFLSQAQFQRLGVPTTTLAARQGLSYGYGLGIYQWQTDGHSFWGHGGDADGYLTRFGFNPAAGQAYLVMINAFNHRPLNQMVELVEQQIIKNLHKPNYPQRLSLATEVLQSYVGDYRQLTSRFGRPAGPKAASLTVRLSGQQLWLQIKGQRQRPIYAVNEQHFRTVDDSTATMAFVSHEGQLYLQGSVGNYVKITE